MEAFHVQKWSARETPPTAARVSSPAVILRQSRHSPVARRNAPTMRSENASRQTAIAAGSALASGTSGPANETPRSDRPNTQYGLRDIKKKEPVHLSTGSFSRQPYSVF